MKLLTGSPGTVAFVIDTSGSMEPHRTYLALAAYHVVLARGLERYDQNYLVYLYNEDDSGNPIFQGPYITNNGAEFFNLVDGIVYGGGVELPRF